VHALSYAEIKYSKGDGASSEVSGLCKADGEEAAFPFKKERFIVIISETSGQAEQFLENIKRELVENELLMTDFPEMTIATDSVDRELIEKPRRWNIQFIRSFMLTFGILSSVFDYLTFGVLLLILHATTDQFRTGWFIESVISASVTVLVIRTRRSIFRIKPGKYLLIATLLIVVVTILFPFTPLAELLGFQPLPITILLVIGIIVVFYTIAAEIAKRSFYKRVNF